jgi:hypothetical protein
MTSVDGIAWTPYANNPVIAGGTSPVAWREGNTWYMLYEHMIPVFDINLATSTDGMHWTDSPRNPVLHEAESTIPDSVVKEGNTYHLYYHLDINGQALFRNAAALLVNGNWCSASFGALQADTWYQLTATCDGHTLIAYKNGVVTDNNPAPEGPAAVETGTLKLTRHANAAQYFSGSVDEVRVYNRALSAAEVNALAQ